MVAIRRKSTPASKTAPDRYELLLPMVSAIPTKRRWIGMSLGRKALPDQLGQLGQLDRPDQQDQPDRRGRPGQRDRAMHFQKAAAFLYFPLTADLPRVPASLWQRLSFQMATILSTPP